ncbi:MAG: hypothetical protein KGL39_58060 [Patescibacteria group bacterium]|nr:hypothetical protein [Patescibacteria group bacterium]
MKHDVIIHSEAIITVPRRLWPQVRRALQTAHNERHEDYGEKFFTGTTKFCVSAILPNLPHLRSFNKVQQWVTDTVHQLPAEFEGELTFICAPSVFKKL